MLMPKRVKHRKVHARPHDAAWPRAARSIAFGEFALMTEEPAWITSRQIEAARRAMTRYVKRGGKIWIRIFPDKPVTKKPAEVRMGSGKGAPDHWVAVVKPGRILFEMSGVPQAEAAEAMRLASHKLPVDVKFLAREGPAMDIDKVRDAVRPGAPGRAATARRHLYDLRFQLATRQLTDYSQIAQTRRTIARLLTVQTERESSTHDGPGDRDGRRRRSDERGRRCAPRSKRKTKVGRVVVRQDGQDDRRVGGAAQPPPAVQARHPPDHPLQGARRANEARLGDTVLIEESRPLSATKRWRLIEIVARASERRRARRSLPRSPRPARRSTWPPTPGREHGAAEVPMRSATSVQAAEPEEAPA